MTISVENAQQVRSATLVHALIRDAGESDRGDEAAQFARAALAAAQALHIVQECQRVIENSCEGEVEVAE
jgi:hypothetical protein